jgi:hypothetical protein
VSKFRIKLLGFFVWGVTVGMLAPYLPLWVYLVMGFGTGFVAGMLEEKT